MRRPGCRERPGHGEQHSGRCSSTHRSGRRAGQSAGGPAGMRAGQGPHQPAGQWEGLGGGEAALQAPGLEGRCPRERRCWWPPETNCRERHEQAKPQGLRVPARVGAPLPGKLCCFCGKESLAANGTDRRGLAAALPLLVFFGSRDTNRDSSQIWGRDQSRSQAPTDPDPPSPAPGTRAGWSPEPECVFVGRGVSHGRGPPLPGGRPARRGRGGL